ncbi:MAG: tetratricopeptide repeat protein, partial [Candidatus Delongbacteria bacterium]
PREVLSDTTRYEYFLSQTVVIPRYIALLIFPVFQNIDHHIQMPHSFFSPEVLSGIAIIILLLSAAVYLYRKGRLLFSFSILWFFSVIILRSSVLPISDLMTERRLYTAVFSLGLLIPLIWLFFIDRIRSRSKNRNISIIILGIITLLYASACFQRNRVWKNDLTLWTDSVSKSGRKYRPNYNAAKAFKAHGDIEKAQKYYLRALQINPNSYGACNNIGNIYAEQNKSEEAEKYFNRALEINPYYVRAMNNLANLYFQDKEYSKAQKYYLSAIKIDNNFAEAYQNLAILYLITGNYEHALRNYRRVIKLDPNNSQAQKYIKILEDKLKTGD